MTVNAVGCVGLQEVNASQDVRPHQQMASLTLEEKRFLLAVERGDVATTRR